MIIFTSSTCLTPRWFQSFAATVRRATVWDGFISCYFRSEWGITESPLIIFTRKICTKYIITNQLPELN